MLQVMTYIRNGRGLAAVSESVADIVGHTSDDIIQTMPFPADQFCPPEFAAKLKKVYSEEEAKRGETSWKLLTYPFLKTIHGAFPLALLLVFVRENRQWVKTVGHVFLLAPAWYARLPACCKRVVKKFGLLLLGEAT